MFEVKCYFFHLSNEISSEISTSFILVINMFCLSFLNFGIVTFNITEK